MPLISRCIENSVNEQLTDFFESNKLLSNHQYGFWKNHSTTYLTLDMFDKIFDSESKGNTPAIIFLDIKKAFDTVYHKVLVEKLKFMELMEQLFCGLKIISQIGNKQQNS